MFENFLKLCHCEDNYKNSYPRANVIDRIDIYISTLIFFVIIGDFMEYNVSYLEDFLLKVRISMSNICREFSL
jgi:hypothetical protein